MKSIFLLLASAVTAVTLSVTSASAQETQDAGRYQLYPGAVEGTEQGVPVLLDTHFGRSWMLVPHDGGFAWQRIPIKRLGTLEKDLLSQPNPATRQATPAKTQ